MSHAGTTPSRTRLERFAADMYPSVIQVIRLVGFVAYCWALWRS